MTPGGASLTAAAAVVQPGAGSWLLAVEEILAALHGVVMEGRVGTAVVARQVELVL